MTRTDWKTLGILTFFATFILFFISQDSYFYDLHTRVDSAWFFMSGKAWMNGLTPYVDFADSKGPLLWLIYGLGYLIQHTNYLGVFWISCIWYGVTYFISYKIARIFLKDSLCALTCSIIMTLAFFNPWFHDEVRAEDFSLLFLNLSLYRVCLIMYSEEVSQKTLLTTFALLGFSFGALLLIKYNIAVIQAIFILCALIYLIREKINWWKPFLWGVAGFCAVTVPFLCYFLIKGNLMPFIQEYFINTFHTVATIDPNWCPRNLLLTAVHTDNPLLMYLLEWGDLIYSPSLVAVLSVLLLGGAIFLKKKMPYNWMPLLVSAWVFAITIRHHTDYYFNICSFLSIFLITGLLSLFSEVGKKTVLVTVIVSLIIIPFHILAYSFKVSIFNDNINQRDFYKVSYIMSQVKNPTIVNAYEYELGYGILSESMPAGKYWTKQNGVTPEMMKEHEDLILSGKADFVIINKDLFPDGRFITGRQLTDIGYKEYLQFGELNNYLLFSNREGLDVKENATPSVVDLFLKKNPFK